ncbi:hypothetical protein HII31_13394 [Pseudocercospora fuligena]|uniref:Uncharacterized protein n=1 Tax=Pseudocercospora fuligena TaxID=685502 RepID=A0A8H6R664_9PEZI|nr:hypothetical protein HII31_13394 [Pseudocercospora fuligena]
MSGTPNGGNLPTDPKKLLCRKGRLDHGATSYVHPMLAILGPIVLPRIMKPNGGPKLTKSERKAINKNDVYRLLLQIPPDTVSQYDRPTLLIKCHMCQGYVWFGIQAGVTGRGGNRYDDYGTEVMQELQGLGLLCDGCRNGRVPATDEPKCGFYMTESAVAILANSQVAGGSSSAYMDGSSDLPSEDLAARHKDGVRQVPFRMESARQQAIALEIYSSKVLQAGSVSKALEHFIQSRASERNIDMHDLEVELTKEEQDKMYYLMKHMNHHINTVVRKRHIGLSTNIDDNKKLVQSSFFIWLISYHGIGDGRNNNADPLGHHFESTRLGSQNIKLRKVQIYGWGEHSFEYREHLTWGGHDIVDVLPCSEHKEYMTVHYVEDAHDESKSAIEDVSTLYAYGEKSKKKGYTKVVRQTGYYHEPMAQCDGRLSDSSIVKLNLMEEAMNIEKARKAHEHAMQMGFSHEELDQMWTDVSEIYAQKVNATEHLKGCNCPTLVDTPSCSSPSIANNGPENDSSSTASLESLESTTSTGSGPLTLHNGHSKHSGAAHAANGQMMEANDQADPVGGSMAVAGNGAADTTATTIAHDAIDWELDLSIPVDAAALDDDYLQFDFDTSDSDTADTETDLGVSSGTAESVSPAVKSGEHLISPQNAYEDAEILEDVEDLLEDEDGEPSEVHIDQFDEERANLPSMTSMAGREHGLDMSLGTTVMKRRAEEDLEANTAKKQCKSNR